MATALLFPGQGSQTEGMRELVERHEPALAELALSEVGADPFALADSGTAYAQPAILCASLAAYARAGRPAADFRAGHSLGELSSLAAAGAIDPADAVRLAVKRGRLMQEAGERSPGGMVALVGDAEQAREAAAEAGAVVANDNGPTQIVVAGSPAVLEAAVAAAKQRRVRAIELAVTAAFHTPAMEPAVAPFRVALADTEIRPPAAPVIACSTAQPFRDDAEAIRDRLAAALIEPVRWRETVDELYRRGVRSFVETGPGKGLIGMVRRAFDDVETSVLRDPEAARA
jgi:[acyl-carrier-protein] S-malonyltransferase